jgi:polysaccharide biosynthesis transport protein
VLDPPSLPEKPTFPNRWNFAFGGLAGGFCLGGGIVLLLEARDQTFRTEPDVVSLLKLPVLVSVPRIDSADLEHTKKKATVSV